MPNAQDNKPEVELQNNLRHNVAVRTWYNPLNNKIVVSLYESNDPHKEVIGRGKADRVSVFKSSASTTTIRCRKCKSTHIKKDGHRQGFGYRVRRQRFRCLDCGHSFV